MGGWFMTSIELHELSGLGGKYGCNQGDSRKMHWMPSM
jgi:hypothetical protein